MSLLMKKSNLVKICAFFILIVIYLLSLIYQLNFFTVILGFLFLFFLPGYFINKILKLDRLLNLPAKIGFMIVSSVAIINFLFILISNNLRFVRSWHLIIILGLVTILFFSSLLISQKEKRKVQVPVFRKDDLILLVISLLP